MRFIHLYLIGYFALAIGAGLALWQAGILWRISPVWTGLTALVVVALGLLLAFTSSHPRTAPDSHQA
ncbi:MAG: hypothetical protein GEU82_16895 [Luteitalea sp.]|nr:hypothetical protein [Luteitalea sp.]